MKHWYIYLAVVIGGASVLSIEILGTRIIGPFYGVSLYLWSALIGVTLAALSLGYALGGALADRGPRLSHLGMQLALAGVWIILIPWIRQPVLAAVEPLGLRAAVLSAAFVLFFPPLVLLGMVSPYAVRLRASSIEVVGRTAGNLYAISTIASVVSAIATGFLLIPSIGVGRLTFLIGLALVITGIIGWLTQRGMRVALPAIILLAALGGASTRLAPSQSSDEDEGLLTITQSAYAEIRVVDKNGLRYLLIDGGTHTIVDPQTWKSSFPYVDVMDLPGMYFQEPGNLLVVGLGGGSVVKRYAQKGWRIDAVEIDPVVTSVAYQYFGLEREEARVFHMDGRRYLKTRDHDYDIVVMDAFGSSSIPFHLVTVEAFELIASRLSEGGLLAMNIESVGWYDILVRSLVATMKQVFPHVTVLPIEEPRTAIGNVVIMASGRELELREELPDPISRLSSEYNRVHAWVNSFEPDITGAPVLTDDLNPVDIWAERINLVARRNLHTYFGSNGLGW